MWRLIKSITLFSAMILLVMGCSKENTVSGEAVEIYLLKEYSLVTNRCEIVKSSIVLKDNELISNNDIVAYHHPEHNLTLTEAGLDKLDGIHDNTPFCMTVDKEIIYAGFFKPGYSSSSCVHSVTIDPISYVDNQISVRLGYPGTLEDFPIEPDPRENSLLLETFKKQGKLK